MAMSKVNFGVLSIAVAAALQPATPTRADGILEEVVVSAQKREQNIQDVGIAIQAFTGNQMKEMGVTSSFDIAAFTPGVHISGNLAGQNTQFSIRGVTQNDFNDIVEAPNAVYLDEGYIAVAQGQTFGVYDIDRVEVLKGPQGTLFGRNATGGLVHYVSTKPTFDKLTGYVDVTEGEYDSPAHASSTRVEAAVGGPLTETLAGRVAVLYNQHDGYLKNIYPYGAPAAGSLGAMSPGQGAGANLGDEDTKGGRVTLDYKPNDDILVRFAGNYVETKVGTGPYQSKSTIGVLNAQGELINVIDTPANETRLSIQGLADGGANAIDGSSFSPGAGIGLTGRPVPGGDFFGYKDPDGAGWLTSSDYAFADNGYTRTSGANVMLDWNLGGGTTFSAITDYKQFNKSLFIDVDSAPVNQLANYAGVNANSLTEELRLSGHTKAMRWVTGLYYLTIDNHSDNGLKAPVNSIINTAFGAPFDIGVVSRLKTDSLSLFGQGEWDLSDKLTLTAGARGIHEKKDFNTEIGFFLSQGNYTFNQGAPLPNVPVAGAPFLYSDSNAQNLWAGKVQLDYHLSNDVLLYGGLNRGVKAGSYNAPLLGAYLGSGGNASLPYKAEQLTSFETGFKSTFNDGRTRLNGSVFYYDYKDYQAFLFVGVGGVVINRPATNIGAELTLQTQITDGLDLSIGLSKYDATVKDVPLRYGSPLPPINVKPTYSPETQASAVLRYEWPAWGGKLHVLGEATYTGSFFYNLRNFSADQFPSVVMLNGGFGWTSLEKTWQVSLEGRNLSDAKAGVQGFDLASLCGCNEVSYQPPRWFGLRLKRSF